jgi:uncharacterized protein (DUF983 family)
MDDDARPSAPSPNPSYAQVTPAYASLKQRCPRCGKGAFYAGLLKVVDECAVCGLALGKHEQGDGPAFFVICIIGTLAGIFATLMEVMYAPPYWLHAAIWGPFVVLGSIWCLRITKALLVAVQYQLRPDDFAAPHSDT